MIFAQTERAKKIAALVKAEDFKNHGFTLVYQPKYSLMDNLPTGVEALSRWHHPELGHIDPMDFVQIAEQNNLMLSMTRHILGIALSQSREWLDMGLNIPVAINVSPQDLHSEGFIELLEEQLEAHRVPPRLIELEVTENAIIEDPEIFSYKLNQIRSMGIRIAIDDFGVGYANFANLRAYPFDTIKIDKAFILDMQYSEEDRVLVRGAIDIAHNLGMNCVAEGVETDGARAFLVELGCEQAQGTWFCGPESVDEITGIFMAAKTGDLKGTTHPELS